jgi:hypothetical protein
MRALINITVVLLICLVPSTLAAQQYTRFRLPEGTRLTVNGTTYQGFTLTEYTELLRIDEDLSYLTQRTENLTNQITALTNSSTHLRLAITLCDDQKQILFNERLRVSILLREENRLRLEAENATSWNWIPWSLAAGLAITTTILGIILGVQ